MGDGNKVGPGARTGGIQPLPQVFRERAVQKTVGLILLRHGSVGISNNNTVQVGATGFGVARREASAPEAAWRERARATLSADDVWISGDWRRNYLAQQRFGLRVIDAAGAPPTDLDALAPGRVVVDGELPLADPWRAALAGREVWTLRAAGLAREW